MPPTSISAARLRRARWWVRLRGASAVAGWAVAFLVLADVAMNVAFPPPPPAVDPKHVPRYAVRSYLNYGRSTLGKLAQMVRPTGAGSAPIVSAGWVDGVAAYPTVSGPPDGRPPRVRLATFGMSFSNHISQRVRALDPSVQIALYAGPEAPPNHTFATYRAMRALGSKAPAADVVCWGILASSVKGMVSETGMTWAFEQPYPMCYPRYTLDRAGHLQERWPPVRTEADLRAALADPARMAAFRADLAVGDRFYDPVAFGGRWADRSALLRLVRRAYADRRITAVGATIDRRDGFAADDPDVGPVLVAMCREFAATAKADGRRPLVLLIQDGGSTDHLYRLLGPPLTAAGVPFVSTHEIVDTSDRSNFNADDPHFTTAAYDRVAKRVLAWIDAGR